MKIPKPVALLALSVAIALIDQFLLGSPLRFLFGALQREGQSLQAWGIVGIYVALCAGLATLLLLPRGRWPVCASLITLACVVDAYRRATGEELGARAVETAFASYGDLPAALKYFGAALDTSLLRTGAGFGAIALASHFLPPVSTQWLWIPAVSFLAGCLLAFETAGHFVPALPRPLVPVYLLGLYARNRPYQGPRDAPRMAQREPARARHIIVIVDESIRGDALELNGSAMPTTPFLRAHARELLNFGVVPSPTNHSEGSNYALMTGLRMEELPDLSQRSRRAPLLLDYALASGRHVHFLWGQTSFSRVKQSFKLERFYSIDVPTYSPGIESSRVDRKIAELIDGITRGEDETLTWVNKRGAHFPYDEAYPRETGEIPGLTTAYAVAVRWSVDGFFEDLYERLRGRDVVVIYTSDHGQSFSAMPHNTVRNPPWQQAAVPLFVWSPSAKRRRELFPRKRPIGDFSSDQIFSTALYLMGYSSAEIGQFYAPTLLEAPVARARRFLSGSLWGFSPSLMTAFPSGVRGLASVEPE